MKWLEAVKRFQRAIPKGDNFEQKSSVDSPKYNFKEFGMTSESFNNITGINFGTIW